MKVQLKLFLFQLSVQCEHLLLEGKPLVYRRVVPLTLCVLMPQQLQTKICILSMDIC